MSLLGKNIHKGKRPDGSISLLRHNQEPFTKEKSGLVTASSSSITQAYLQKVQPDYGFNPKMLLTLNEPLDRKLRIEDSRLRYGAKKLLRILK